MFDHGEIECDISKKQQKQTFLYNPSISYLYHIKFFKELTNEITNTTAKEILLKEPNMWLTGQI